ncbi:MAG TPA: histidine kinase [Vicinamibacterales bacterium]
MQTRPRRYFSASKERTIAATRVVLVASGMFAVWLDPVGPPAQNDPIFWLHVAYVLYALGLAGVMWNRDSSGALPVATHVVDIIFFSIFQYLTLGPSSPFFVYFIFSIFSAALRWHWPAIMATSLAVVAVYVSMAAVMSYAPGFDLSTFLIRTVTRLVTGGLIIYLAQYEIFLRAEIERLARWPTVGGLDSGAAMSRVLAHAAGLLSAERALIAWDVAEEPRLNIAMWSPGADAGLTVTRHPPGEFDPLVPAALGSSAFLCMQPLTPDAIVMTSERGSKRKWRGLPVHPSLADRLVGHGVASAPFQTARIAGRAFFSGLENPSADLLPVTEVVARELGTLLDQQQWQERLREIAVREQRISLARDLHDGVLQSLTGVRLELQAVSTDANADVRDRLLAIERALAIEQRELRLFIDETRPAAGSGQALAGRLESLRERVALEWKIPVSIRLSPESMVVPEPLQRAIPLMAHEAIVNALKHAHPSRISIDVRGDARSIHVIVSDDGSGFPFEGRYDHAVLTKMNLGPTSLRERAASLGGEMTIESTKTGSRIEIAVPIEAGVS